MATPWFPMRAEAGAAGPEAASARGPSVRCSDLEFELRELLHDGELTEVWRARSAAGAAVALKQLKPRWRGHPGAVEMLRREHRVLSILDHPSIVASAGFLEHPDCCAVLTEHLGGGDLVSLTGTAPGCWLDAALDVVAALEHVHACGFVHGDVKARNVLFASGGRRAKLIDFGSAESIGGPLPRGGRTPAHEPRGCGFAQDHVRAGRSTEAQDVYALAVLLYELLAGRLPFGDDERACDAKPLPVQRLGPAGDALIERVVATLHAPDAVSVGTLTQFRNVLESVRTEWPGRPKRESPEKLQ